MKIYDRLAGKLGLNPSRVLSREETLNQIPTLEPGGLQRGVSYYDGQFDDSRLAVNLAQTIFDLGVAVNYMPVVSLIGRRPDRKGGDPRFGDRFGAPGPGSGGDQRHGRFLGWRPQDG
jgi:glycerol-3-phosphate dehydrogenase